MSIFHPNLFFIMSMPCTPLQFSLTARRQIGITTMNSLTTPKSVTKRTSSGVTARELIAIPSSYNCNTSRLHSKKCYNKFQLQATGTDS